MEEGFSTYNEALDWLHGLLRFGQKPGLERMRWMLGQLGHPERRLAFVHVAGTNGKGSTCAYLTQMLQEAGYSVGTFTSPYITDFRERIRYNGALIPQQDLLSLVNEVKPLVELCEHATEHGSPTEFEVITTIAILYYAKVVQPAVVIWETGLGGRLDSTNVVAPLLSVITNVGLDHTDVLGDSIESIAREKAGIIKPGIPVVLGNMLPEALAVMEEAAKKGKSSLYKYGTHYSAEPLDAQLGEQRFRYEGLFRRTASEYRISLNGTHQVYNAALAVMVIDLLREFYSYLLDEEEIAKGLQQTRWPGRLEVVGQKPLILLDGAHNVEGMQALVNSLQALIPAHSRINLLIAGLADKPLAGMAAAWRPLQQQVERVYVTTFDFPRAASAETLLDSFGVAEWNDSKLQLVADWHHFLRTWMSKQEEHQNDVLIVCGSLYFISQVRAIFPITVEEAGE
ncbi:dihydrofolate synthase/folylpolyglutamate synthase [Brevibacillus fulvus]|uniref:Dihydrofolate synthase/folylpolyglutamate synthase n=2 Tax=Brevibacillus fulvus TaxID=1125967 RepID=A0A938Y100_9BACL|nr:dihydrofolate synthase/folylpolyglutamate synthase [Brevibacillus fulvus]